MNTNQAIRKRIMNAPRGEPFATIKFLGSGKRAAVDQAISRLVKAGEITRIARGIFVRPEKNKYLGTVMPDPIKVAKLVAQNTGSTIQVHGAEAAYRLSLTTQIPTQLVFYTSGSSRHFQLGNLSITLKHISPRKLLLAGRPAGLAFTALWYLGKQQVTIKTIEAIQKKLSILEFEALQSIISSMPGWMADVFIEFTEKLM
jgi:hypothetical protein